MIFTIIEIILVIFAWRNGWKWRSLIPIAIIYLCAIILGFVLAITRTTNAFDIRMYGLILNLGMFATLSMMILIPRDKLKK
jgi:hypothetical protein